MKRILYIFFVAVIVSVIFSITVSATDSARLFINGLEITAELDTPPVIMNDRTLVPARAVFERMGGNVYWNEAIRQVTVVFNNDILVMTIDNVNAILNDRTIIMEVPPIILNGRTLIPLRFTSEVFGFYVSWDIAERIAFVNSADNSNNNVIHTYYHTKIYGGTQDEDNKDYYDNGNDNIYDDDDRDYNADYYDENYNDYYDCDDDELPKDYDDSKDRGSVVQESHPQTTVINFFGPDELGLGRYSIEASSPITNINYFLLYDNRLVVDIYNSISDISAPFPAFEPVREVRSAQFLPNVTRVVFELTEFAEFDISLSENRQTITVAFSVNIVREVVTSSTADSDMLMIRSDFGTNARISPSGFSHYMTVYIDNAEMAAAGGYITGGAFAFRFVTGQLSENLNTAYIRVYLRDEWPIISIMQDTDGTNSTIIVLKPPPTGVRYNFSARELILSRDFVTIGDINRIRHLDEYLENRYTLTIPSSISGLGLGAFSIGDGFIDSVEIRRDASGNTVVVFDTARVMTFRVHQTPTKYIIRAHLPQEVYQFIVVIDPGHGGRDPGAVHNGIREADLVLTISHMVMEHLNQNPNIKAYMTRHTNAAMPNRDRAAFANQMADLYVSIHANAVGDRPSVNGIETWYMNHSREEILGFSSRQFATIMQNRLINATGANNRGLRTNPNFIVLRDTNMPAVLLEVGFLTNAAEAARLATAQHQRLLARAIYQGIVEAFSVYQPPR